MFDNLRVYRRWYRTPQHINQLDHQPKPNKKYIHGESLQPLELILLIAAIFDIEIFAFWIPSEENIVADAASR
jgi:hypothetical protein